MFGEINSSLVEFVIWYNIVDKNAEESVDCCNTFCASFVGELNKYWGIMVCQVLGSCQNVK